MKQFRITTENLTLDSPDDCTLSVDDPIHELKAAAVMDGLGAEARLQEYRAKQRVPVQGSNKGRVQREQGIKPGTDEWFRLWFTRDK